MITHQVATRQLWEWVQIYLSAELKVDHDDGDLWAGDDQDDKDEEQKSKHVVKLILPDCLHVL